MIGFDIRGKRGLAIAEKPSLARTIEEVFLAHKNELPYQLTFISQRGHLLGLKRPDEANEEFKEWSWDNLPITEKNLHGWQYKVTQEEKVGNFLTSQERFDQIKQEVNSGKYDFIVHIGDPDREGQLLIDLVLEQIGNTLPVMRYWQNALTDEKVLETLKNLRSNDEDFFQNTLKAGKSRQHADYLIGMNLSRAASLKMGSRVSVGRVKDVLLALVCRRELEIRNFKPKTTYGVQSVYAQDFNGTLFKEYAESDLSLENEDESSKGVVWFNTKKEAEDFINATSKTGEVTDVVAKRVEQLAPSFYKLATIQKEAGAKFGYKANKTLNILQTLYDAKYLTYPRSTCEFISSTEDLRAPLKSLVVVPGMKDFLSKISPESIAKVKKIKKWVNDEAIDESGHTAIIPTSKAPNWNSLTKEQQNIYELVAKQYIAAFLPPLVQDVVKVVVTVDGDKTFQSNGKTLISLGYKEVFGSSVSDVKIPSLNKGDEVVIKSFEIPEKTTRCPKRYTSAELVTVCEKPKKYLEDDSIKNELQELKIGTPATLSTIIEDLVVRDKYATWIKEGKREVMKPSSAGEAIYENFVGIDFSLLKVDTTGNWEIMLDEIVKGNLTMEAFEQQIDEAIVKMIGEIKNGQMKTVIQNNGLVAVGTCHKCGGNIIQTEKSFYCTGYKENGCMVGGFRNRGGHLITVEEFQKLQAGEQLVFDAIFEKKDEKGKVISKQPYKQRVGLNADGTIENIKASYKDSGYTCPACGNHILESDNAFVCQGRGDKTCNVYVGKVLGGVKIPDEDLKLILSGKESRLIKKILPKQNGDKKPKPYNAILFINKETKALDRRFETKATKYICPVCDKHLVDSNGRLVCEDNKCGFQVYSVMYNKPLSENKIEKMLEQVKTNAISGGAEAFITKEPVKTEFICPFCSNLMTRNGTHLRCDSCTFAFYRTIGDELMTDQDIKDLLSEGKTAIRKGLVSQKGSEYSARQVLNKAERKLELEFAQEKQETSYSCPLCNAKMMESGKKMNCSSCEFNFWTIQGGIPLTKKELDDLFKNHITEIRRMKKKAGGYFEAMIVVDREKKTTAFAYPERVY